MVGADYQADKRITKVVASDDVQQAPQHRKSSSFETVIFNLVFISCFAVNLSAAVSAPIQDCDEVFNYWEPTHYLSHGFGLQTWEYSPKYAIRSWLYIALHAAISRPVDLLMQAAGLQFNEFIWSRAVLATVCAYCQSRLFKAAFQNMGPRIAFMFAIAMMSSTGTFYASIAYLPSSFSMYTSMMGMAAFLEARTVPSTTQSITWFGVGAIVGWPFSAALITPFFVDEIISIRLTGDFEATATRIFGGLARVLPIIVRIPLIVPSKTILICLAT